MDDAMQWLDEQTELGDLALFLDFDGTLAPIVDRPGEAAPLDGVVALVEGLARVIPVAVISGRGLDDVKERLGATGIYYAGSHGMEIEDPQKGRDDSQALRQLVPAIEGQRRWLEQLFESMEGVEIERKQYGVAVHFRRRPQAQEQVERAVEEAASKVEGLTVSTGKMVRELQPDVAMDKGTALETIRSRIDVSGQCRSIYIGDDRTDEDAFEVLGEGDVGILVAEKVRDSAASLRLADPFAVKAWLTQLARRLDATE